MFTIRIIGNSTQFTYSKRNVLSSMIYIYSDYANNSLSYGDHIQKVVFLLNSLVLLINYINP